MLCSVSLIIPTCAHNAHTTHTTRTRACTMFTVHSLIIVHTFSSSWQLIHLIRISDVATHLNPFPTDTLTHPIHTPPHHPPLRHTSSSLYTPHAPLFPTCTPPHPHFTNGTQASRHPVLACPVTCPADKPHCCTGSGPLAVDCLLLHSGPYVYCNGPKTHRTFLSVGPVTQKLAP